MEQLGPGFARTNTPHFVILSDCDRRWVQARADLLERTRTQFLRVANKLRLDPCPPSVRLVCILFNRRDAYLSFAMARDGMKSPWMVGYYSWRGNRVVYYNEASNEAFLAARDRITKARLDVREARESARQARNAENAELADRYSAAADELESRIREEDARVSALVETAGASTTIHEAVHLLAFNTGVQRRDRDYPFWLSEGLATAFQTEFPRAAFGPDRSASMQWAPPAPSPPEAPMRPIAELITIIDSGTLDSAAVGTLYRQSQALFAHLYGKDGHAIAGYIEALNARPPGRWTPAQHAALFTEHFGDPDRIQSRMVR
jgi:hypothetical protein